MVVRKLALVLLVLAACRAPAASRGPMPGAPAPRAAVEGFLAAVRAQDLQAMSSVWGSAKGPARDVIPDRAELEKRELVMQCYLNHESFRILGDVAGVNDGRVFRVELTKGPLTRATTFTTIRGPSDRWYVLEADLAPVKDLCRS
jgi:hypothetical protein